MNIDTQIQALFAKLEDRKQKVKELKENTQKSWVTNGTWAIPHSTAIINIQTISEQTLVQNTAIILGQIQNERMAHKLIHGAEPSKDYKFQGYTEQQWMSDIVKRKSMIEIRSAEAKLTEIEAALNSVLSPEERRRIEVEMIAKQLGE